MWKWSGAWMMRVKRSVLLKRENNIYHLHILFYMQGSSLLIRSECLLLLLLLLLIIIIILLLSFGIVLIHGWWDGGCHPVTAVTRFSKVSHGKGKWRKFWKSGDTRWHGDNPHTWKLLLKTKTKKENNMNANKQSYYWTKS